MLKQLTTEVSLLAVWDASFKAEQGNQSNLASDRNIAEFMNKGIAAVWGTGGDGTFSVEVRTDDLPLTDEENGMLLDEVRNLKLIVEGEKVYFGSTEWMGKSDTDEDSLGTLNELDTGIYSVDVYYLSNEKDINEDDFEDDDEEQENGVDYVVILKKVDKNHEFSKAHELKTLG